MTGSAGHIRLLKTEAGLQELQLFAMNVGFAALRPEGGVIKMGQGIAGDKVKKRSLGGQVVPGVAGGAKVQPLLAGERLYGYDVFAGFNGGVVLLEFYMAGGGSMTSFTVYAIYDGVLIQGFADGQGAGFYKFFVDIRGMAFETAAGDHSFEAGVFCGETGAIDPIIQTGKISQGKLVEHVLFPIPIGLGFSRGAEADVERLGGLFFVIDEVGLGNSFLAFFDMNVAGIVKIEMVFCRGRDQFFKMSGICFGRCLVMIVMDIGVIDILMTGDAGFCTGIGLTPGVIA
jgi:hypothetical protein